MAKELSCERVLRDLNDAPRLRQADVFLLQEVADEDGKPSVAHQLAQHLGYSVAFSQETPGVHDRGLAVVSRYPISGTAVHRLREYNLRFHSRNRFAIATTVHAPDGDVRVWNLHLDTRLNARERLDQMEPVMSAAIQHTGARLIGGDFNTNDCYWIANVLPLPLGKHHSTGLRTAMERHGFTTPFADNLITNALARRHLDWVFANGLQPLSSSVEPVAFSDHHAIWVNLRMPSQAAKASTD